MDGLPRAIDTLPQRRPCYAGFGWHIAHKRNAPLPSAANAMVFLEQPAL